MRKILCATAALCALSVSAFAHDELSVRDMPCYSENTFRNLSEFYRIGDTQSASITLPGNSMWQGTKHLGYRKETVKISFHKKSDGKWMALLNYRSRASGDNVTCVIDSGWVEPGKE